MVHGPGCPASRTLSLASAVRAFHAVFRVMHIRTRARQSVQPSGQLARYIANQVAVFSAAWWIEYQATVLRSTLGYSTLID